jgi:Flp pilus assembly pilin Flp
MGKHRRMAARHRIGAQEGQALIEYAFVLALIALLAIGVLHALGQNASGLLGPTSSNMAKVLNS